MAHAVNLGALSDHPVGCRPQAKARKPRLVSLNRSPLASDKGAVAPGPEPEHSPPSEEAKGANRGSNRTQRRQCNSIPAYKVTLRGEVTSPIPRRRGRLCGFNCHHNGDGVSPVMIHTFSRQRRQCNSSEPHLKHFPQLSPVGCPGLR